MRLIWFVLTPLLLSGQSQPSVSSPSQSRPIEQLIEELTKEVRMLRLSLEQWHLEDTRRVVVIERYRVERDATAAVFNRLEAVRAELAQVRIETENMQEQMRVTDDRSRTNTDREQQANM